MTVHAAPTITWCCRMEADRLPEDDRITSNPAHVTCRAKGVRWVAEHLARQIAARHPDRPAEWIASHVGMHPEDVEALR